MHARNLNGYVQKWLKKEFRKRNFSFLNLLRWIHFFSVAFNPSISIDSTFSSLNIWVFDEMFTFNSNNFFQFVSSGSFQNQHIYNQFFLSSQNLNSTESIQIQPIIFNQFFIQVSLSFQFSISSVPTQDHGHIQISKKKTLNAVAKYHTQFLRTLKRTEKTFRIECTVIFEVGVSTVLKKTITQTDQKFEMNVISKHFLRQLKLPLNKLFEIGFEKLIMRTTDHKNTPLKYWTEFIIIIEKLNRLIREFVFSRVSIAEFFTSGHYSLLLRLPWLYAVNAILSIKRFIITIEDPNQRKLKKISLSQKWFSVSSIPYWCIQKKP